MPYDSRDYSGRDRTGRGRASGPGRRTRASGPSSFDGARTRRERDNGAPRTDEGKLASRRTIVKGGLGVLMGAGVLKLAGHQIFYHDENMARVDARRLAAQTLYAKRGTLYDRNGNVLASSVECANVAVNPQIVKDSEKVVAALVDVLGVDEDQTRKDVAGEGTWVYIKRRVDADDVDALEKKGLSGIEFEPTIKRVYPYGTLASQVLGVVNIDNEGITGLELQYDEVLTGVNGQIVRERAADGSYIAGGAYSKVAAQDGCDLVLTLDANIQRAAEDALAEAVEKSGAHYGSVIVTDPTTGEILAACSNPTYDPTDLSSARTEDMNLRVVTDAYEPGSVFKALVCGMGIDLGLMDVDTTFEVPASVKAGDDDVTDVDDRDYGMTMTLREIMRRSSNTGMVLVGKEIGADSFASYIDSYGIGAVSGVDFPGENRGIVKARDEYDGASVAAMSFGQSLAVSPIEVMRAISAISNGGVMTCPHFLKASRGEEVDWSEHDARAISKNAAAQVADMMRTVVDEGTGSGGQVEGYDVSGKTGTAQRASEEGGYQEGSFMASFMGFAPTDDPKVQVYVTLDGTSYTSAAAAGPFAKVMAASLSALGVSPTR